MSDALPEHIGQIESEMATCAHTAAHQNAHEFKQTEVVGAVGFGVYDPFGFVVSPLVTIVGRGYEQTEIVSGVQLSTDVSEELAIGSCFSLYVFSLEGDSEGEIRVSAFGFEGSQEGRGYFEKLVMCFSEEVVFFLLDCN